MSGGKETSYLHGRSKVHMGGPMGSGPGSWLGPLRPVDTQGALALFWYGCSC